MNSAIEKINIYSLLLITVFVLSACEPTDDSFDIQKITGAWSCDETYNSEGDELLDYRITITTTGTNSCTIGNYMNVNITVPATVSEDWSINVPEYVKGSYTYWGSGKVNISKMTMTLDMRSKAGSTTERITADCKR